MTNLMKSFGRLSLALRQIAIAADLQNGVNLIERKYHPTGNLDEEDLPKSERHRLHREEFLRGQA